MSAIAGVASQVSLVPARRPAWTYFDTMFAVLAAIGSRVEVVKGRVEEVVLQAKARTWCLRQRQLLDMHVACVRQHDPWRKRDSKCSRWNSRSVEATAGGSTLVYKLIAMCTLMSSRKLCHAKTSDDVCRWTCW